MDREHPLRLTIEVERSDPLEGRVGASGQDLRPFVSWVGLAAKLEELLAGEPEPPAGAAGEPTD